MKKTFIALMALAGAAAAAVQDGYLTNPGALTWEALTLTSPANGVLTSGNSAIDWSEETGNLTESWELSFVLDPSRLDNQYLFGTVKGNSGADGYTLSITNAGTISLNANKSESILTVGSYTADDAAVAITLTFVNYVDESGVGQGGEFTLTVNNSSGSIVLTEEEAVNTTFTKGSNNNIWTNSGREQFSGVALKQGGNMIIPEPATATLSLLALAGLAARRRRK